MHLLQISYPMAILGGHQLASVAGLHARRYCKRVAWRSARWQVHGGSVILTETYPDGRFKEGGRWGRSGDRGGWALVRPTRYVSCCWFNLLKPTGCVQQPVYNLRIDILPKLYLFCIYLRTNSDLCHLHHKLIGFYNRVGVCLLRGTDWVFK